MLGLISSTIFPSNQAMYHGERLATPSSVRLDQTVATVKSLIASGVGDILIADNSGPAWEEQAAAKLFPAKIMIFEQFQFHNKGLSEIFLLLTALQHLPENEQILKISGRYKLEPPIPGLDGADLATLFQPAGDQVSTRCYISRDRRILEMFLRGTLQEFFRKPLLIEDLRSALRLLRNIFLPGKDPYIYFDPPVPIETAAALAIKKGRWKVKHVKRLGLTGTLGGLPQIGIEE